MAIVQSVTEQSTAITDLFLAIMSLGSALYLRRFRAGDSWKANLWSSAFALLGVASVLGAVAHGLDLRQATRNLLWQPIYLALGLAIALFVVGGIYDLWGHRTARYFLPILIGTALVFFAGTRIISGTFLVFVVYEVAAMCLAVLIYTRLVLSGALPGAKSMLAGVLITILAAGVQASRGMEFTLIWRFDHNGIFHLIQIAGVLAFVVGLRCALNNDAENALTVKPP